MIYGHELERGWSTGGLLCGMVAGVVLGTGVGLILALTWAPKLDRDQAVAGRSTASAPPTPSKGEEEERTC